MRYFGQIITHYITTALRYAGASVDSDTFSELNGAMQEVIRMEERVTALETELQAIRVRIDGGAQE
jgi:negative regulator of sigma E activity